MNQSINCVCTTALLCKPKDSIFSLLNKQILPLGLARQCGRGAGGHGIGHFTEEAVNYFNLAEVGRDLILSEARLHF